MTERLSVVNDLEIYFNKKLKFNFHVDKIINIALAKLRFLKRKCSEFKSQHALKMFISQ